MAFEVEIQSLGGLGDGIAEHEGRNIFVPYTTAGDTVRINFPDKNAQNSGRAVLEKVLKPSPERIKPPCPYFAKCGGCSLQHINEKTYHDFKRDMLVNAVSHAGYETSIISELVSFVHNSRRRADFKVRKLLDKTVLGFYEANTNHIVDISTCYIMQPEIENLINPLREFINAAPPGLDIRSVSVTASDTGIDLLFGMTKEPLLASLEYLTSAIDKLKVSRVSYEAENRIITISELTQIAIKCGSIMVGLPPGSFIQAVKKAQDLITELITNEIAGRNSALDLFCGIGTYSFPISQHCKVTAMEIDEKMVTTLQKTVQKNQLGNKITASARNLMAAPVSEKELEKFDVVVMNPPRVGAHNQCKKIAASKINKLIMVSCNPATFSRDAEVLKNGGFKLTEAIPIDQFIWSPHLEIFAVFER